MTFVTLNDKGSPACKNIGDSSIALGSQVYYLASAVFKEDRPEFNVFSIHLKKF